MFALPRYVIKAGQIVLDDGELRSAPDGRSLHVAPEYDPDVVPEIEEWFSPPLLDPVRQLPGRRPGRGQSDGRPVPARGQQEGREVRNPRGARRVNIQGVAIDDTFAEAFPMTAARAIVTAETAGLGRDRRPRR